MLRERRKGNKGFLFLLGGERRTESGELREVVVKGGMRGGMRGDVHKGAKV